MKQDIFFEAHAFLWRDKTFFPWITTPAASNEPILFLGPGGFDADTLARFCWLSSFIFHERPFIFENAHCFKSKKQLLEYLGKLRHCDFHLRNLQDLDDDILRSLPWIFSQIPKVRLLGSMTTESKAKIDYLSHLRAYFRNHTFNVPPLAERQEDFVHLIQLYSSCDVRTSMQAQQYLKTQRWPGDCKDLRAFVHSLDHEYVKNFKQILDLGNVAKLYMRFKPNDKRLLDDGFDAAKIFETSKEIGLKNTARLMEAMLIQHALQYSGGKKNLAARSLHMSPSTLISRIQSLAQWMDLK